MKCHARCNWLAMPDGYGNRAEWFEKMARTHEQRQCEGCGLWTIWVQRRRKTPTTATTKDAADDR